MRCAIIVCLLASTVALFTLPVTAQDTAPSKPGVLILPLEPLSGGPDYDAATIAKVMHRSLVVDLSRSRDLHASEATEVAPDRDAALAAGKDGGATFVVWGTAQYVEGRVRVDGEVLDVDSGDSTGRFRVTGTLRELFELQDLVAEQVRRHVAAPANPDDQPVAQEPSARVPDGEPLRIPRPQRERRWAAPPSVLRDDITHRYNYGHFPYWYSPYWSWPYRHHYGGYGFYPYRPLGYRLSDACYTYDGLPDRPPYYHFHGPVPLRWFHRY